MDDFKPHYSKYSGEDIDKSVRQSLEVIPEELVRLEAYTALVDSKLFVGTKEQYYILRAAGKIIDGAVVIITDGDDQDLPSEDNTVAVLGKAVLGQMILGKTS